MTRDEAVKLLLEELIDKLAVQLGISGAESRETRWADERWQRGVLGAALAALTAPAAGEDVELVHALEEAVKSDLLGGTTARPALTQTARDALLSRLRAVPRGWRDIETAPKDGTRFLGYCRLNYWVYSGKDQVRWTAHEPDWHVLRARTDTGEWVTSDGPNDITQGPTRWMPLPAAPAPEKGEG